MNEISSRKEMITLLFDAMNSREFTSFEQVITEDVVFDFPGAGRAEGERRTLLLLKSLLRKYPDLRFTVSDIIVDQDRACAVWINEGNDIQGIPYRNSGITLFHFTGGKICFISDYFKDTSFTGKYGLKN
ncbi:MAG: nuclear transport factor 2 family protein [Bacteroidales bacterium]